MAKRKYRKETLFEAIAIDGLRTEKQLNAVIEKIVAHITSRDKELQESLALAQMSPRDLEALANIADLKIRIKENNKTLLVILRILKGSVNQMIVASIELREN